MQLVGVEPNSANAKKWADAMSFNQVRYIPENVGKYKPEGHFGKEGVTRNAPIRSFAWLVNREILGSLMCEDPLACRGIVASFHISRMHPVSLGNSSLKKNHRLVLVLMGSTPRYRACSEPTFWVELPTSALGF
jgi:hypothetical protein